MKKNSTTEQLLSELVSHVTVSSESNLGLIDDIQEYLEHWNIKSTLIYSPNGNKANLWATIGPDHAPGTILSGHTDVVPADESQWSSDPFTVRREGSRLYGRGCCDMKGFLASLLAAVPMFAQAELQSPIHLAFSYDEEVGCRGVHHLLNWLRQYSIQPKGAIIGEPTQMQPILGHKGKLAARCKVTGVSCHSAYAPQGVNAIEYAALLISRLTDLQRLYAARDLQNDAFAPPFSTIQTGIIQGGTALNIVPDSCSFDWEMRTLPGANAYNVEQELIDFAQKTLLPQMQAINEKAGIQLERLVTYPPLGTAADSDIAGLIKKLVGNDNFGTVAFGTEAGLFQQAGIPAVVCGPGNMDQGHKKDEFIEIDQLDACDSMMVKLCRQLTQTR